MAAGAPGAILVASGPWDPEPWAAAVKALDPGRPVAIWPDVPDPAAIRYVMAWRPPRAALTGLPNLAAIFSLGAGVDHIVFEEGLPDVPIVRIVSPDLTRRMTEWVIPGADAPPPAARLRPAAARTAVARAAAAGGGTGAGRRHGDGRDRPRRGGDARPLRLRGGGGAAAGGAGPGGGGG